MSLPWKRSRPGWKGFEQTGPVECVPARGRVVGIPRWSVRSLPTQTRFCVSTILWNLFIFFHSKDSYSRVFSLLHPATSINVTITRGHREVQSSVSGKIMNLYRILCWGQTWAMPCSQTDPGLISPLLPATLLQLCMLFGKLFHPCMSVFTLKAFCLLPPFGLWVFQDRNHFFQNSAPLSIPKMTRDVCQLIYMVLCVLKLFLVRI